MFKTVKVSVTAERNRGDVNLLSRIGFLAYVEKNVFILQASQRHDQDS